MKTHELKCWTGFFEDMLSGKKNFEVRLNDRDFKVGDVLHQREFIASTKIAGSNDVRAASYTGRELRQRVDYVMRGPMLGLKEGWVVMSVTTIASVR
jgi:hypothetical protein